MAQVRVVCALLTESPESELTLLMFLEIYLFLSIRWFRGAGENSHSSEKVIYCGDILSDSKTEALQTFSPFSVVNLQNILMLLDSYIL